MAMLLKGADAARALTEQLHEQAEELKKNGTEPCLAILRVGAREDDLSYERGALKRCEKVGHHGPSGRAARGRGPAGADGPTSVRSTRTSVFTVF